MEERGLPPSRLILQHASAAPSPYHPDQRPELKESNQEFKCDQYDYRSPHEQGLSVHKGHKHKKLQKPATLRV